jgi:NADPH-dependent 7-cyano-7-deazaguanine reductase QueF
MQVIVFLLYTILSVIYKCMTLCNLVYLCIFDKFHVRRVLPTVVQMNANKINKYCLADFASFF